MNLPLPSHRTVAEARFEVYKVDRVELIQTWKWGLATHLANCLASGSWIFWNWDGSMTSSISSISPRNMTCLGENIDNFQRMFTKFWTSPRNITCLGENIDNSQRMFTQFWISPRNMIQGTFDQGLNTFDFDTNHNKRHKVMTEEVPSSHYLVPIHWQRFP